MKIEKRLIPGSFEANIVISDNDQVIISLSLEQLNRLRLAYSLESNESDFIDYVKMHYKQSNEEKNSEELDKAFELLKESNLFL